MTLVESQNAASRVVLPIDGHRSAAQIATIHPVTRDLKRRAQAVAAVAAGHAAAVDAHARFPHEAISALRAQRLLGILVPAELGGENARISDAVDVCYTLGRACASTAMIYAMHQIMVASLVRHARDSIWHARLLSRLCAEQLLLASSTTEGQGGGDLRKSDCAIERNGTRFTLAKSATVISYGAQADAIVTTARRSPDAPATDQVLVTLLKSDYSLKHLVNWDTLGMRGTCSTGYMLQGDGSPEQILSVPYSTVHAQTVMPVAHFTWAAVWAGTAAASVERARAFVRNAARKAAGQQPPGAAHLTRAVASLAMLRASVAAALQTYEGMLAGGRDFEGLEFQATMNLLKVNASELAIAIVTSALQAAGLAGYRNDGDYSVARHMRDALSSSIMINNDRILRNVSSAALLIDVPASLSG